MPYSYSKSKPGPSYQTSYPSRVTPVNAMSFSGPHGGSGLGLPFLGLPGLTPSMVPEPVPEAEPSEAYAPDPAYEPEGAYAPGLVPNPVPAPGLVPEGEPAPGRLYPDSVKLPGLLPLPVPLPEDSPRDSGAPSLAPEGRKAYRVESRNSLKDLNNETARDINVSVGKSPDEVYGRVPSDLIRDQIISGELPDTIPDQVYGYNRSNNIRDVVISGDLPDLVPDQIYGQSGYDDLRWRSFADVEDELPDTVISSPKMAPEPVLRPSPHQNPVQLPQIMRTTTLQNVPNLPVPEVLPQAPVPAKTAREKNIFEKAGTYLNNYMVDKMENPARELGIQLGASLAAAPIIGMAPAAAAAVPQIVNAIPQAVQSVKNVGQNVGSAIRNIGAVGAGAFAGSAAMPAFAESSNGWNASTQTYKVPSSKVSAAVNSVKQSILK